MVWECIRAFSVKNFCFINGIMDYNAFNNILNNKLGASAEKINEELWKINDNIFTQDNDKKHPVRNTESWLLYNTPKYFLTPSQLFDMNPIEHWWNQMGTNIKI